MGRFRAPHNQRAVSVGFSLFATRNPHDSEFVPSFSTAGGGSASAFSCDHICDLVKAAPEYPDDLPAALRTAIAKLEDDLRVAVSHGSGDAGTCALVALLHGLTLHVAHVGDCRAVVVHRRPQPAVATVLTVDHRPGRGSERRRIEAAGGFVTRIGPSLGGCCGFGAIRPPQRVVPGRLAVSRALGDFALKYKCVGAVVADPDVTSYALDPTRDLGVVMATDGLWDSIPLGKETILRRITRAVIADVRAAHVHVAAGEQACLGGSAAGLSANTGQAARAQAAASKADARHAAAAGAGAPAAEAATGSVSSSVSTPRFVPFAAEEVVRELVQYGVKGGPAQLLPDNCTAVVLLVDLVAAATTLHGGFHLCCQG